MVVKSINTNPSDLHFAHPNRWLINRGVHYPQIKVLMESGFEAWAKMNREQQDAHHDEHTWYLPHCSRGDAERLLFGKPTGTFLIRPSSSGDFALSIACNNTTNHCIIYETAHGFGFAIPYNVYQTLLSLVLHYAHSSLEEHNDQLPTTLKYPVLSTFVQTWEDQQSQLIGSMPKPVQAYVVDAVRKQQQQQSQLQMQPVDEVDVVDGNGSAIASQASNAADAGDSGSVLSDVVSSATSIASLESQATTASVSSLASATAQTTTTTAAATATASSSVPL